MKILFKPLLYNVFVLFLLISCQNKSDQKKTEPLSSEELTKGLTDSVTAVVPEKEHPGKAVYQKYCLACHQADGSGVPNMHPPLTPGSWVGNPPEELIAIMMKGLSGKIEVNGEIYKNFMPSNAKLSDDEIADVLSYIRTSFGNNFEPVKASMVTKIRSGR